jgi:nuclease S1
MKGLTIVLALVACLLPHQGFAWGRQGHQVVANLAQSRLTPAARKGVAALLHGATLASISTWADDYRNGHPQTARWHYVDIPLGAAHYDPARDCKATAQGDCIIAAIERFSAILRDASRSEADRADAMKFLVHFVADLHQPLHSSTNNDRGGNDARVTFLGRETNLHSLWDSGLIEAVSETVTSLTDECERLKTDAGGGTPIAWAEEAHDVAAKIVYAIPADHMLGRTYLDASLPVLKLQLLRGGVRLAAVLNSIFGGTTAATVPARPTASISAAPSTSATAPSHGNVRSKVFHAAGCPEHKIAREGGVNARTVPDVRPR